MSHTVRSGHSCRYPLSLGRVIHGFGQFYLFYTKSNSVRSGQRLSVPAPGPRVWPPFAVLALLCRKARSTKQCTAGTARSDPRRDSRRCTFGVRRRVPFGVRRRLSLGVRRRCVRRCTVGVCWCTSGVRQGACSVGCRCGFCQEATPSEAVAEGPLLSMSHGDALARAVVRSVTPTGDRPTNL